MAVIKRGNVWYVSLHLGGKRIKKSAGQTATQAQAKQYERKLIADYHANKLGKTPARPLANACLRWVDEYVSQLADQRTVEIQLKMMMPYIQGRTVDEIATVAEEVRGMLLSKGRAVATRNRYMAVLRRIGNLCAEWKWIDVAPRINLERENNERTIYLTRPQVVELAAACPSETSRRAVLLAAMSGLRQGELLRLQPGDIEDDCLVVHTSKSGKPRRVPLLPEAMALLEPLPLAIARWKLNEEFIKARKAVGMEHVKFHDLRHTYASWLAQAGIDLHTVGALLGHSSPSMTKRYAHHDTGSLRRAVVKAGVK